jgi:putative endonuclease
MTVWRAPWWFRWLAAGPGRWWRRNNEGSIGQRGERAAADFLQQHGFRILEHNYRNHVGEIDLIAEHDSTLVFVEVKTRSSMSHGQPSDAVHQDKQRRLVRVALVYLKRHGWLERSSRFDVVDIVWADRDAAPQIRHYVNAFDATGRGQLFS